MLVRQWRYTRKPAHVPPRRRCCVLHWASNCAGHFNLGTGGPLEPLGCAPTATGTLAQHPPDAPNPAQFVHPVPSPPATQPPAPPLPRPPPPQRYLAKDPIEVNPCAMGTGAVGAPTALQLEALPMPGGSQATTATHTKLIHSHTHFAIIAGRLTLSPPAGVSSKAPSSVPTAPKAGAQAAPHHGIPAPAACHPSSSGSAGVGSGGPSVAGPCTDVRAKATAALATFGLTAFRAGQLDAVAAVLSGEWRRCCGDSCCR